MEKQFSVLSEKATSYWLLTTGNRFIVEGQMLRQVRTNLLAYWRRGLRLIHFQELQVIQAPVGAEFLH
jgi:hypothetical protein